MRIIRKCVKALKTKLEEIILRALLCGVLVLLAYYMLDGEVTALQIFAISTLSGFFVLAFD